MRTRTRAVLLAAVTAIVAGAAPGLASVATAQACVVSTPDNAAAVRGYTFEATLKGRQGPSNHRYLRFRIHKVYTVPGIYGDPDLVTPVALLPDRLALVFSSSCDGYRKLRIGDRYIVSTSDIFFSPSSGTAVWRMDGRHADWVPMHGSGGGWGLVHAKTRHRVLELALEPDDVSAFAAIVPNIVETIAGAVSRVQAAATN